MTLAQAPALPARRALMVNAERCAHCHRELPTGQGIEVPFVGVVGPECQKHYASLIAAVNRVQGLQALEWDKGTHFLADRVVRDLRFIGLNVQIQETQPGVKEVRIVGMIGKPKIVIEKWESIRARFEQRLVDAQAEREAQGLDIPMAKHGMGTSWKGSAA